MHALPILAVLTAVLASAAAADAQDAPRPSSGTAGSASPAGAKDAGPAAETPVEDLRDAVEDAALELERLRGQLEIARQKKQLAALDAAGIETEQAGKLEDAQAALAVARAKLEHFSKHGRPIRTTSAEIARDAAKYAAEHAQAELAELEAMYDAEEFAEMTKELVLRRGRRNLELALRRLEIENGKIRSLAAEMDREQYELERAVRAAERTASTEEKGLEKARIRRSIALDEAEAAVVAVRIQVRKAERALHEAREKLAAADGKAGAHGADGEHGGHGEHGADGKRGGHEKHGADGKHGGHGKHGADGKHGGHGKHGADGKHGGRGEHGGHEEHGADDKHGEGGKHGRHGAGGVSHGR